MADFLAAAVVIVAVVFVSLDGTRICGVDAIPESCDSLAFSLVAFVSTGCFRGRPLFFVFVSSLMAAVALPSVDFCAFSTGIEQFLVASSTFVGNKILSTFVKFLLNAWVLATKSCNNDDVYCDRCVFDSILVCSVSEALSTHFIAARTNAGNSISLDDALSAKFCATMLSGIGNTSVLVNLRCAAVLDGNELCFLIGSSSLESLSEFESLLALIAFFRVAERAAAAAERRCLSFFCFKYGLTAFGERLLPAHNELESLSSSLSVHAEQYDEFDDGDTRRLDFFVNIFVGCVEDDDGGSGGGSAFLDLRVGL